MIAHAHPHTHHHHPSTLPSGGHFCDPSSLFEGAVGTALESIPPAPLVAERSLVEALPTDDDASSAFGRVEAVVGAKGLLDFFFVGSPTASVRDVLGALGASRTLARSNISVIHGDGTVKRHKMPRSRPWACGVPVNVARHEGLPTGIAASAVGGGASTGGIAAAAECPCIKRAALEQHGALRQTRFGLVPRGHAPFSRRLTEVSNPLTT